MKEILLVLSLLNFAQGAMADDRVLDSDIPERAKAAAANMYGSFIRSEFPEGIYCQPIGNSAEEDKLIVENCRNIRAQELAAVEDGSWARQFHFSFEDKANGRVYIKRYTVEALGQICDLWGAVKDQFLSFSVYCD